MSMFCFQCEQTYKGSGCTIQGVCGKKPDTANLQDELTSSIIELANCAEKTDENTEIIIDGLFVTITNVNFDNEAIEKYLQKVKSVKKCDSNFDVKSIWNCDEDIQSLKSLILFGLKGMAAYAHHARVFGYKNEVVDEYFYEALQAVAKFNTVDSLLPMVLKTGEVNLKCMELLDMANTQTYGNPVPTVVSTNIEKGPFIVVSGHDLHDLALLLE